MDEIKRLEMEVGERMSKLNALRAKQKDAENASLVGKCFKYRNCYSMPGPDDYWYLYAQIIRAEDGGLAAFTFQTDNGGKVEINPDGYFRAPEGYKPITLMEFLEAWDALKRRINQAFR